MRKPFINFTNHPSAHWNPTQTVCARQYGEIEDIPFPDIPPEMTQDELYALAEQYLVRLLSKEPCCVLCQGESVFTALMVSMLMQKHIPVVAAVSKRTVQESTNENGQTVKCVLFEFTGFREYILYDP